MGTSNNWLKKRQKRQRLIAKIQNIAVGSLISAVIVGPLIYFGAVAVNVEFSEAETPGAGIVQDISATPEIGIMQDLAATPEIIISEQPIKFDEEKTKEEKEKEEKLAAKKDSLKVELQLEDLPGDLKNLTLSQTAKRTEPEAQFLTNLNKEFDTKEEVQVKILTKLDEEQKEEKLIIAENLEIQDGPKKIQNKDDAKTVAIKTLRKYLKASNNFDNFSILQDTSNIKKSDKKFQLVLSNIKTNNDKWYVTFQQYKEGLPVFDGNIKMIFTEQKSLLVLSDNARLEIPDISQFAVDSLSAENKTKEVFDWDETLDSADFIGKGYYKNKPAYRIEADTHNPLGEWQVLVNGETGEIERLESTISLQDSPVIDYSSTPEPTLEIRATAEPAIVILDTIFSQVLGGIFPKTSNDPNQIVPFENEYVYYNLEQYITNENGYFENENLEWYSVFLEGPYVTVRDDLATSDAEIKDRTPEDPFVWDENNASLEAINAFYHTNKIRKYYAEQLGFEIDKQVDLTVNSELVDLYLNGCGAWFDNNQKTIEMGTGGSTSCPDDLNYALGSDFIYHEYAHYAVEEITHLPNITGAESAAMAEGLADYFAATINDDPLWGDVIAPGRERNLENTMNYQTDMIGQSHHDGQIFAGALWDLRQAIGQEQADQLVLNTLYQDRLHFETFMYGMIIEDDDNNDFSDGTPNLIAIIRAFENHGIGPGVKNFDGLPIDPEMWSELLQEASIEFESDESIFEEPPPSDNPLYQALSGDCDGGTGALSVASGNTCTITGGTYTYTSGSLDGTLVLEGSANVTFTSTMNVYSTGRIYNRGSSTLTINSTTTVWNGAYYYTYQQATSNLATVTVFNTGTFQAGSANDGGYINLSGTLSVYGNVQTVYDGLSPYYNSTITGAAMTVYSGGYVYFDGEGLSSFSGVLDMRDGATVNVRDTGDLDINNTTYVDNGSTLDIDAGGLLDINNLYQGDADGSPAGGAVQVQGDVDIIGDAYLFDGGVLTVSSPSGNFGVSGDFFIGDTTDGTPAGGHVENSDVISVTGYTYLIYNSDANEGDIDNNSGASFSSGYLVLGASDGSPAGGDIVNAGTMDIGNTTYIYRNGLIENSGTSSTLTSSYIQLNGTDVTYPPKIINGGTITQDTTWGSIQIYDYGRLENNYIINATNSMSIDQSSVFTEGARPLLTNISGKIDIAGDIYMADYAQIHNDTVVSSPSTQYISAGGNLTLNNNAKIINTGRLNAETSTTELALNNDSQILNAHDPFAGGLAFDSQTINFTTGGTITGLTSGATATIVSQKDNGTAGSLTLTNIQGAFIDNEGLSGSPSGYALANGILNPNYAEGDLYVYNLKLYNNADLTNGKPSSTAWGNVQISNDIFMDGTSSIQNYYNIFQPGFSADGASQLYMVGTGTYFSNGSTLDSSAYYQNQYSGVGHYGLAYLLGAAQFHNYGSTDLFILNVGTDITNSLTYGGDFYNFAGGTLNVNRTGNTNSYINFDGQTGEFVTVGATLTGSTSGSTGIITAITDYGTTGIIYMRNVDGLFQNNELLTDGLGGAAWANGTVTQPYAATVNQGTIQNAGTMDIDGRVSLTGASVSDVGTIADLGGSSNISSAMVNNYSSLYVDSGSLTVDGNGTTADADVSIYGNDAALYSLSGGNFTINDYFTMWNDSLLDNDATFTVHGYSEQYGTSDIDNDGTLNLYGGHLMATSPTFNNGIGDTVNIGDGTTEDLTMKDSANFTNNGSVYIIDDLLMGNTEPGEGSVARYTNTGGAVTSLTVSADNELYMLDDTEFINYRSNVEVDYATDSPTDGIIIVYENANIDNTGVLGDGVIQAEQIHLGYNGDLDSPVNPSHEGGTINNYTDGIIQVSSSLADAFDIRAATLSVEDNSYIENTGNGTMRLSGVSGPDYGSYYHYSAATSTHNLSVHSLGVVQISNGVHAGNGCGVYEEASEGQLIINASGTLDCWNVGVGSSTQWPGVMTVTGVLDAGAIDIYEDDTGYENDQYELKVNSGGYVYSEYDIEIRGGELYNDSGDGTVGGNDGVVGEIEIMDGGRLYNGEARDFDGYTVPANVDPPSTNSNAEINYLSAPTATQDVIIYEGGVLSSSGKVGGDELKFDDSTSAGRWLYNNNIGDIETDTIQLNQSGLFYNGNSADLSAAVNTGAASGNDGTLQIYDSTIMQSYGDVTTDYLNVGDSVTGGGTLHIQDGQFDVTNTGSTAATVDYAGSIIGYDDADGFIVYGRLNIDGTTSNPGVVDVDIDSGNTRFGELYIASNGGLLVRCPVQIDSGIGTGTVDLTGGTGSLQSAGITIYNNITTGSFLWTDGPINVNAYGVIDNQSDGWGLNTGGLEAKDLVTVAVDGIITSDEDSRFDFEEGLLTAGTVDIVDSLNARNKTSSGLAIEVTDGTTTLSTSSHIGDANSQDIEVSGGIFTSYADLDVTGAVASEANVTVTGGTATANFAHSTPSTLTCSTDIHGDFNILDNARAYVNCQSPVAVNVYSNSPGGHTQVEGTLYLNTNMTTETMQVGTDTIPGMVTHDVYSRDFPLPLPDQDEIFHLHVDDSLVVAPQGELNVEGKSAVKDGGANNWRGGSFGGRGQSGFSVADEAGDSSSANAQMGYCGRLITENCAGLGGGIMNIYVGSNYYTLDYESQTADFTVGETLNSLFSTAEILADDDQGDYGTLTIKVLTGTFRNGNPITDDAGGAATAATSQKSHTIYNLDYGSQTADFTIGDTLTGPSGSAIIIDDTDTGPETSGTLKISIVTGTFNTSEIITDESGGSATTTSGPSDLGRGVLELNNTTTPSISANGSDLGWRPYSLTYGSQTAPFTIGAVLTSATGSAYILDDNTTDTLTLDMIDGTFSTGQLITDSAGGSATATSDLTIQQQLTAGSGGTINIYAYNTITGAGDISANGGPDSLGVVDGAGGGGRIYLQHWQEDTFDITTPDHTGIVSAIGGENVSSGHYGGVGTIHYRWEHPWANQNDGTTVIDGFSHDVDVDADGTVNEQYSTARQDETLVSFSAPGVESVQIENNAIVLIGNASYMQQCLDDGTGSVSIYSTVYYNRDHGTVTSSSCLATPDPPATLYINNSGIGAGSEFNGEFDYVPPVEYPHIQDLSPDTSALHKEGRFDSNGIAADSPLQEARQLQVQIGYDELRLYESGFTVTGCDMNTTAIPSPGYLNDDGTSRIDYEIPSTCANNLTGGEQYYYRYRFLEDTDNNDTVSSGDLWGLWSETNMFYIDESGTVTLDNCNSADLTYKSSVGSFTVGEILTSSSGGSATIVAVVAGGGGVGTLTINTITDHSFFNGDTITDGLGNTALATSDLVYKFGIGTYDSSTGDNFFNDSCEFETEATVPIYMKANKTSLEKSDDPTVILADMFGDDYDPLTGMDGLNLVGDVITNEVGFHLSGVSTPPWFVYSGVSGQPLDTYYNYLPSWALTTMDTGSGYSSNTFSVVLGAYLHGLIPHPTDPILNTPTGRSCGGSTGGITNACTTQTGTYTGTVTLTAATTP